jgi:exopolyphosphatase / guanosine-5'-triphosphate,3'-diphosphate pyrophosphatase
MGRIAIIDMGTNTFHLLVAEERDRGYRIIHRDRLAVKIGMGGINRGVITEGAIQRTMVALQSFRNTMDRIKVQKVYAFGTSALRNASNSGEVAQRIKQLTGIEVNVITGDQEAEFIYQGVKSALDLGHEKSLIIDIGGGSVEFIVANNEKSYWKESFEIGAQRLLEKFQHHDPILEEEILALNGFLDVKLGLLHEALKLRQPSVLVGSSGTFDTLSDIFCKTHKIIKTPDEIETPLTLEGFYEIYDDLLSKNREERMLTPGMIEMRVDMIVVACCLIRYILKIHHFSRVRVSTYSLKEGVLSSMGSAVTV